MFRAKIPSSLLHSHWHDSQELAKHMHMQAYTCKNKNIFSTARNFWTTQPIGLETAAGDHNELLWFIVNDWSNSPPQGHPVWIFLDLKSTLTIQNPCNFLVHFWKGETVVYKLMKRVGGQILCSVPSILSPRPGRVHFLFLFPTLLGRPSPTWQDAKSGPLSR